MALEGDKKGIKERFEKKEAEIAALRKEQGIRNLTSDYVEATRRAAPKGSETVDTSVPSTPKPNEESEDGKKKEPDVQ